MKVTFKQRDEVFALQKAEGREFQVEKTANAKVQRWENSWLIKWPAGRTVCLKQSKVSQGEKSSEEVRARQCGAGRRGSYHIKRTSKDYSFYSKRNGKPVEDSKQSDRI